MAGQKNVAEIFAGQIGKVFSNFFSVSINNQAKYA